MGGDRANLIVADPPYNLNLKSKKPRGLPFRTLAEYMDFCRAWVGATLKAMAEDSHLYVWLGADLRQGFQPLPDFMIFMREQTELRPHNYITMRNQRGYGTQKNWMWVRQELLHYLRGSPRFKPVYTDIPKILRGYYKSVGGKMTENLQRSLSPNIRPGNVWVDIQQVFYRMEENVQGCYAQKPLKAIERILLTSTQTNDIVGDFFCHSGTTLMAGEMSGRRVYTSDIDPVFAEIAIRRLENYRRSGRTGWQRDSPFPEWEGPLETHL
jgi:site-specific DNA-methyltransferase (adenine-specific)